MTDMPDSRIEHEARRLYQRAVEEVDTVTTARLRAARRTALEGGNSHRALRWMVPAGALAASIMAAVLMWRPMQQATRAPQAQTAQVTASTVDSDLPPDPDSADPAIVEDMAFYAWLADQPIHTRGKH